MIGLANRRRWRSVVKKSDNHQGVLRDRCNTPALYL